MVRTCLLLSIPAACLVLASGCCCPCGPCCGPCGLFGGPGCGSCYEVVVAPGCGCEGVTTGPISPTPAPCPGCAPIAPQNGQPYVQPLPPQGATPPVAPPPPPPPQAQPTPYNPTAGSQGR